MQIYSRYTCSLIITLIILGAHKGASFSSYHNFNEDFLERGRTESDPAAMETSKPAICKVPSVPPNYTIHDRTMTEESHSEISENIVRDLDGDSLISKESGIVP